MTQPSFDFDITERKHQGNTESRAAFQSGAPSRARERAAVLEIITRRPSTAKEIAEALKKPLNAVSPRCSELKRDGLIVETDQVRARSRELRLK